MKSYRVELSDEILLNSSEMQRRNRRSKTKKRFPAFRKTFWDDIKYNPSMSYAHISYEYDAHSKEERTHWSRAQQKFLSGPRIINFNEGLLIHDKS